MGTPPSSIQRRYRILGPLGEGGLGRAYRVWDDATEQERALKLVDAAAIDTLRDEFALLAGLYHPRLVRVHDFGTFVDADQQRVGFYTADLLVGMSLSAYAARHRWPAVQRALGDALEGLAFLHGLGIRHGDFKPDNIIVGVDGRATLIDLSCAARFAEPVSALSGTPGFLAPELAPGAVVDERADFYSVGATLRQLASDPPVATLASRLCEPRAASRPAAVVDILAALGDPREIERAHARSARLVGRQADIAQLQEMLDALLRGEPSPRALCITGDLGIGKTRLLAEMKWRAQLRCDVAELVSAGEPRPGAFRSLLARAGAASAPAAPDLDAVLRAAEELVLGSEPCALFIDDADALAADDLGELEAVLRSLPDDGRLLVLLASERPIGAGHVAARALSPLSRDEVAAWAGALVSPRRVDELCRLTGGHPAHVEATLRELSSGRWVEDDLATAPSLTDNAGWRARLASLPQAECWALALLVAGPMIDPAAASDHGDALAGLALRGLAFRDAEGFHGLAQQADRESMERALPVEVMLRAHREVAASADDAAIRLRSLIRSGQLLEAERMLAASRRSAASPYEMITYQTSGARADVGHAAIPSGRLRSAAQRWSDALDELACASRDPSALVKIAEAQRDLGQTRRALAAIARASRRRPSGLLRPRTLAVAGEICLQLQKPLRAARYFERALQDAVNEPRITAHLVRALNQAGRYAEAAEIAERILGEVSANNLGDAALELSAGLGVAAMYLGATALAREHLGRAAEGIAEDTQPRDAARARSYLAISAFREGDVARAAVEHARALDIAERRRLSDMLPTLVLNLATARQQLGAWGAAIDLYERGRRIALALGMIPVRAILELNLAKLYADVGLAERARAMWQRATDSITAGGIAHLEGQRHTVAGDVALAAHDLREALLAYERAIAVHRARGEAREHADAALDAASVMLQQGADPAAHVEDARRMLAGVDASDVEARGCFVEGLALAARGQHAAARLSIDRGTALADAAAQPLTLAEGHAAAAAAARTAGDHEAAARAADRARDLWEGVAATLPATLRETFWRHPRRKALVPLETPAQPSHRSVEATRLRRVLELSARVSSTLALDRVLELAMDAAIELTGAERGFLLLKDATDPQRPMRVAVARNLDRERLGHGDLQFSTGIAEQVVASDQPLVTFDAGVDQRFASNRSVHAMRLKSVVCVPVAARGDVLGALYLDNRFEQGRFGEDDTGVLRAFAGHIAMAVNNARLHAALEEHSRRLALEKRRVERLSRGQARQILTLEERVVRQQQVLERRYDYKAISHRSEAMRRVLDILDRVVDSELTVLIEGESGTGKELVSRAIHVNSRRKDAPLIAINCGALSETLLESELFGHVRGAFTGADADRPGLMVAAQGGTLFLDELGEMSLPMQVKLLRALQEREVRPVGATASIPVDVRVVCATNRDLRAEVSAGRFREDLFYRVSVVSVRLPPLRERPEDILPIAEGLLVRHAERHGIAPPDIAPGALRALLKHDWPGNVRELENAIARAYILSDRTTLRESDLMGDSFERAATKRRPRAKSREEFQRGEAERIHDALFDHRWNISKAARELGIPRNTFYRKLERLGLARP